jgi:AGZA family xanthine/uracil permease-like MFS transporter
VFDQPLVGLIALAIIATSVLAGIPITRWRIPPFLAAWILPLAVALVIGYVRPAWSGFALQLPFAATPQPLHALALALPYLSVIAPIAIYQVLQDIASVAGAAAAGDDFDARAVLAFDGLGTLVCGLAGSAITPVIYAMHPPYKAVGARISYAFWTPLLFLAIVMSGLSVFVAQLFPWAILAAIIAYVSIGVGMATLRRVDPKYLGAVLLGFVLPAGAVVATAINSALPALHLSVADSAVAAALNRSIYWSSVLGLGNGFLLLVLVVASMISELIDRRFGRAATWCVAGAVFSWFGLMHSALIRWGAQPVYALGWLAAALIVYSARWWRGDVVNS